MVNHTPGERGGAGVLRRGRGPAAGAVPSIPRPSPKLRDPSVSLTLCDFGMSLALSGPTSVISPLQPGANPCSRKDRWHFLTGAAGRSGGTGPSWGSRDEGRRDESRAKRLAERSPAGSRPAPEEKWLFLVPRIMGSLCTWLGSGSRPRPQQRAQRPRAPAPTAAWRSSLRHLPDPHAGPALPLGLQIPSAFQHQCPHYLLEISAH